MKLWKLISGILTIAISCFVAFQSFFVLIAGSIIGDISGIGGILMSILMLTAGIVSICTRNSMGKGKDIALIILFGIAAFSGWIFSAMFSDLGIYAGWCCINILTAVISMFRSKKTGLSVK